MGGAKYMVGWPGGPAEWIRAALWFEKYGRPAGQPTMYLASPVHFGGILLVLVYYWIYFHCYVWYFPYYGMHY